MTDRQLDPEIQALAEAMRRLERFLTDHAQSRWAAWVGRDADLVARGDGRGVTHFLAAFGGAGSLADLRLGEHAGVVRGQPDPDVDRELDALRADAWRRADALRNDAEAV